jgi:hypothetical protein
MRRDLKRFRWGPDKWEIVSRLANELHEIDKKKGIRIVRLKKLYEALKATEDFAGMRKRALYMMYRHKFDELRTFGLDINKDIPRTEQEVTVILPKIYSPNGDFKKGVVRNF